MNLLPEDLLYYNSGRPQSSKGSACWSPAKNLFIGLRGKVMSCCYNKSYVLGEYPSENLHDIWFGEKRSLLAETLEDNNFSKGCQGCYEAIKARNFNGLTSKKFDHLPINKNRYPSRIDFELSNECNLECKMCRGEFSSSIRRNVEKLPPIASPYGTSFLKELEEFIPHLSECHFLGGEPFLIPIYQDIWERIIQLNPAARISIVTNATLLSTRVKNCLEHLNSDICVSIDSVEKQNYENIRRNARFETVMENIFYLNDYCKRKNTRFNLSSCAMTLNSHELIDITKFANSINTEVFFTRVSYPRELSLETKNQSELNELINSMRHADLSEESLSQQKNKITLLNLANHLEFWKNQKTETHTMPILNFSHYLNELKEFLNNSFQEKSSEMYENISTKLCYVMEEAEKNQLREKAESKMIAVPFKTLADMVPGISKEHLLHLFEAFVMPVKN